MTNGKYKLIHFYGPSHVKGETYDGWELYDLDADPNELRSVYDDQAYQEIQRKMHAELKRLREEYQVPEDTR